jgi:hypothetical protein
VEYAAPIYSVQANLMSLKLSHNETAVIA